MIEIIVLPDIGEGVVEGEVVEWLKNVGDQVTQDEPVVVVMTDKATVELPSPFPGVLAKQCIAKGKLAKKDDPLYEIEREKVLATPATRRVAKELDVDINTVQGSGKEGRVTTDDLAEGTPLSGIRRLMKESMAHSKATIPHFSYFEALDATRLITLREHYNEKGKEEGIHVTFVPFIMRALSLTIKEFPLLNSFLRGDRVIEHPHHNIGIAINTEQGLIVPVLHKVETYTLPELVQEYERLKKRALEGCLTPEEMRGGTITISNFGVLGGKGLFATAIIRPKEVAILALARIQPGPWVLNRELVVRDILNLSWSFDHRLIDGDLAARASYYFSQLLQDPAPLI